MMDDLLSLPKRDASRAESTRALPSFATVVNYNPTDHTCKVILQSEGEQTNWLLVIEPFTGGGSGASSSVLSLPVLGQQVFVAFEAGSRDDGVVLSGAYSRAQVPSTWAGGGAVQPREIALVSGGSNLHIQRGPITVTTGTNLALNAPGGIALTSVQPIQNHAERAVRPWHRGRGNGAPGVRPARCTSLADVIAQLAAYGLSA